MLDITFKTAYANILPNLIFVNFSYLLHTIFMNIYVIQLFMYKIRKYFNKMRELKKSSMVTCLQPMVY